MRFILLRNLKFALKSLRRQHVCLVTGTVRRPVPLWQDQWEEKEEKRSEWYQGSDLKGLLTNWMFYLVAKSHTILQEETLKTWWRGQETREQRSKWEFWFHPDQLRCDSIPTVQAGYATFIPRISFRKPNSGSPILVRSPEAVAKQQMWAERA